MRISYFLNLLTTLFIAGSMLLQFFVILTGVNESGILRKWYWLRVDTSSIQGGAPITEYNLWGFCTRDGNSLSDLGESTGCSPHHAAYGFQPDEQFGSGNVPQWFVDHHSRVYWLTRLLFPWLIISLVFSTPVLFMSLFSCVRRRIGVANSLLTLIAWLFQATAAAMATVAYVQSRDAFKDAGHDAKLGQTLIAFMWTCTFLLAVNVFVFCCIRPHHSAHHGETEESAFAPPPQAEHAPEVTDANETSGGRFFGFRNSTAKSKSAGDDSSFVRAH